MTNLTTTLRSRRMFQRDCCHLSLSLMQPLQAFREHIHRALSIRVNILHLRTANMILCNAPSYVVLWGDNCYLFYVSHFTSITRMRKLSTDSRTDLFLFITLNTSKCVLILGQPSPGKIILGSASPSSQKRQQMPTKLTRARN